MEFKAGFSAAEADRAALAEITSEAGVAGARLAGAFVRFGGGRADAFGVGAGDFFAGEGFAGSLSAAFLDLGSARAP